MGEKNLKIKGIKNACKCTYFCTNHDHFKFHFCTSDHCSGLIRENGLSNCILHDKQKTSNNLDVAVDEEVDTEVAMW